MPGQADPESELFGLGDAFLAGLPEAARSAILAHATVVEAAPGDAVLGGPQARLGVVSEGLAREYLSAGDGRQMTIRYLHPGVLIANLSGLSGERGASRFEAVVASRITEFDAATVLRLARSDAAVGVALFAEAARWLSASYATLASRAFGSMRGRVARHMLDLAMADPVRGGLAVTMTQHQLAQGLGTAREVVARVLREFRDDGLIRTGATGIELVDPAALAGHVGRWRTRNGEDAGRPIGGDVESFLDASPNAIVAVDRRGVVAYINPTSVQLFGWSYADLRGRSIEQLIPERVRDQHARHMADYLAEPTARQMGVGLTLTARRRDGGEFPVEISLSPFDAAGGRLVFATIIDISAIAVRPASSGYGDAPVVS